MYKRKTYIGFDVLEGRSLLAGLPDLAPIPTQFVEEGSVLAVQVHVNNPISPVAYSLDPGAPPGANINASTGLFLFTPPNVQTTYTIVVRATDAIDPVLTTTQTLNVYVFDVPPQVNIGTNTSIITGDMFNRVGTFTDPNPDTWTATVDYGDGSGYMPLSVNHDRSFLLTHVYAKPGFYVVSVQVTDSQGFSGYAFTAVNVTDNQADHLPSQIPAQIITTQPVTTTHQEIVIPHRRLHTHRAHVHHGHLKPIRV